MCNVVLSVSFVGNSFMRVANSVRSADLDLWDRADVPVSPLLLLSPSPSPSSLNLDLELDEEGLGDGIFFFRKARREGRRDLRDIFAWAAVLVEWVVSCE